MELMPLSLGLDGFIFYKLISKEKERLTGKENALYKYKKGSGYDKE